MVRKYIKVFLNIPMFVAGIIIGALYIYFINSPFGKEIIEKYSIISIVPVLWISRFITDSIVPLISDEDLEYRQLLNTLPLGNIVISKIRLVSYLPGFITLLLMMCAAKPSVFGLLSYLASHLVVSIFIDNNDTNPTGAQRTITYVIGLTYFAITGFFIAFGKFSTIESALYTVLLYVPLIIYVFNFMKYKEKRRWIND